jgi:methylamine dehydrogenase heavy chain
VAIAAGGVAYGQQQQPAPLPAETSDVATMPPVTPHLALVMGGLAASGGNYIDADSDSLKVLGQVPVNRGGFAALAGDAGRVFVLETFYSHGNRGTREDVLAVYDGRTLNLVKEITVPGRLLVVPRPGVFDVSEDGHLAYVYDMAPASGVHVVDIEQGKVITSVSMPGCALAFPFGARGFASICGDGTIGTVEVPASGDAKAVFSKPFFEANTDPLFESSVNDRATGEAWFMTYTGRVFPVQLAATPVVGKPWSISVAAGFQPVGTGVQELAWRPGGEGQVIALHRATKHLYVLMHTGNFWTHKAPGSEVWVLDAAKQTLIRRIRLEAPATGIAVSQDASPLLYAVGEEGDFAVLDATSGEKLRKRKLSGSLVWVPGY